MLIKLLVNPLLIIDSYTILNLNNFAYLRNQLLISQLN